MDKELSILLFITRKFPKSIIFRVIVNRFFVPFYIRKKREPVEINVGNLYLQLDPNESIDSSLLFYPQYYDMRELKALEHIVQRDFVILDIGAHIGYYTLYLANCAKLGTVLAIEADPYNFTRLKNNVKLNPNLSNIDILNIGVSDKHETLSMGLSTTGNRSGNSFLSKSLVRRNIECSPLYDLILEKKYTKIDLMKIDIEGFEFRVLSKYLKDSPSNLLPEWILIEDNPTIPQEGNVIQLLSNNGYRLHINFGLNKLMRRIS